MLLKSLKIPSLNAGQQKTERYGMEVSHKSGRFCRIKIDVVEKVAYRT
jgi:hypothetical protein